MNEVVLASLALGALAPAAFIHSVRIRHLADAIAAQRALPFLHDRRGPHWHLLYAGAVVLMEALVGLLLIVSMWREEFMLAGLALCVLGALFAIYVWVLRRKHYAGDYAGDCGCSAFEAAPSRASLLPGSMLLLVGVLLAVDQVPTTSAFSSSSGAMESIAALLLAFTLGFMVWLLPASVYRHEAVRYAHQEHR